MHTAVTLLWFCVGVIFIVKGGDFFVDAASWLAETFGIPKLIVGATVVSFATTLPELLVSSFAAAEGKVDMAIGNAVGIVVGAQLLVDHGSELARIIGVPERIIGVTVIAIGTSLPELVTTLTAIAKGQSSLSVGNIIGANIIDLTLILPVCALISGGALPVSRTVAMIDLPACLLVGFIALVPALVKKRFMRWQGFTLLGVYAVYLFITCSGLV